ncbi:unnamed protein product [Brassica oleracea var. botrytis]
MKKNIENQQVHFLILQREEKHRICENILEQKKMRMRKREHIV